MPPVNKPTPFAAEMTQTIKTFKRETPLWTGPCEDGVTQGMLARFLTCRERFRLLVVEGLKANEGFNHKLEYGNLWHACEEGESAAPGTQEWLKRLQACAKEMASNNQLYKDQVEKWYQVAKLQFPIYVKYWKGHRDTLNKTPVFQEQVFGIPYKLPSGRTVLLRGKWDATDLLKEPALCGYYLQENKAKGNPDEELLKRQLGFDLQSMLYLVALTEHLKDEDYPVLGVRYNVIKRPLSGGEGTIRQHKPSKKNPKGETTQQFYARLSGIIADSPSSYFFRWRAEVSTEDLDRFKQQFLTPILEQLCDWWEWIAHSGTNGVDVFSNLNGIHWRHPYGVYNVMNEGGCGDLDEHMENGSEVGLQRVDNLFPELT